MPATRYMPRTVSQIEKNDSKVSVVGKVAETKESSFVLEDDSGKIEVFTQLEGTQRIEASVAEGDIVRAFCTIIGTQLKVDVIQSLKGLDLEQFKKIEELYNKAGIN